MLLKLLNNPLEHFPDECRRTPGAVALDDAIKGLAQMNIQSSEGDLLHATKPHSHLAYIQAGVGMAYVKPTEAQYAIFQELDGEAQSGEQMLESAIEAADKLL